MNIANDNLDSEIENLKEKNGIPFNDTSNPGKHEKITRPLKKTSKSKS
jgi:hypothetical protein